NDGLALTTPKTANDLKNMVPFGVGEIDTFTYDFKTGYAMPTYNTDGTIKTGLYGNATGCGYYLFTFYTMDLAGRYNSATNVISYYVKADYELPTYTVSKSVNGNALASNEAWGTSGELKVLISQSHTSISGNVLTFVDANSNDVSIAVLDGQINAVNTKSSYTINGNKVSIGGRDRKGNKDGTFMTVEYNSSNWTLTFAIETIDGTDGEYLLLDYFTNFDMMVGSSFAPYIETIYSINNYNADYKNGICIRSDRNVPEAPLLSDTDGNAQYAYIKELNKDNYFTLPALSGRSWFTSGWSMPVVLTVIESGLETYGKDINVFIAMKNIKTIDDFTITGGKKSVVQFVDDFASGYGDVANYNFTKVVSYTGDKLDEVTSLTLDLVESENAGMRLFFVWAIDQAGNCSELSYAYALADANQYYATAFVDNDYFGEAGSVVKGGTRTKYKRGSEANFVFSLDDGFVAYRLEYRLPGEDPTILWEVDDDNATSTYQTYSDDFVTVAGTDFTIKLDAGTDLGMLKNNGGDVSVYFVYREIITFAVTNQNVYYTGLPTDIPMSLNDYEAKANIIYNFKDRITSEAIGFVPSNIGDFKVDISFNDAHYISQKVENMNYSIIPAKVTVSAVAGFGEFNTDHILNYTIEGLAQVDSDCWDAENYIYSGTGRLILPTPDVALRLSEGTAPYTDLAIGTYPILIDETTFDFGDNYDVKFVGANYIVTVKYINVSVKSASKEFGASDPQFEITVNLAEEDVRQSDLSFIFKNATLVGVSGDIATLKGIGGAQLIMRNAGEDVGTYAFSDNASAFEMDENYGVTILRAGSVFTIGKLTVNISVVEGQIFTYNEDGNYSIAYQADNAIYASLYTGKVTLGAEKKNVQEGNYKVYTYGVNGQNISIDNIDFVFDTTGTITVKQWTDSTLPVFVLTAKQNITLTYGDAWNPAFDYNDWSDMFDIEYLNGAELPYGYSLRWTAALNGGTDYYGFYSAGTYTTVISNAKVYNEKKVVDAGYTLIVSAYQVTVAPVEIEIAPVVSVDTKTYGDAESTYQIGFDVANVPENIQSAVDKDMFSGAFARAIYENNKNKFVAFGAQFDFATDENGFYKQDGIDYYYGAAVNSAFVCDNANFIPVVKDSEMCKPLFFITPAEITLDGSIFQSIGKDKDYDGSSLVKYTDNELKTLINIGRQLKQGTDDVFVTFTANYPDAEVGVNKKIVFTNIHLGGSYATNYVLVGVEDTYETEAIFEIKAAPIVLTRNHFDITKVYDGTKELNANHIIISDDCALFGTPFKVASKGLSFASKNVTSNFSTSIVLFFPGISSNFVLDEEKSDEKISVETTMYEGEAGLKVTILDLSGSITPKVVTINDLASIVAINRRYNGYSAIATEYAVRSGIIQEGDTIDALGFI
nr:YDG domain-containing protein [Clostridia bacterium]